MAKSKARRNIIAVTVLFVLTGALIFFMKSFGGPPVIGPEPEEISKIRLSSENAYFQLAAALKMLPPVAVSKQITGMDFEKGPLAELLDLYLKEDAPEIASAIEASRPAVKTARQAVRAPHFLLPIDWEKLRESPYVYYNDTYRLFPIMARIFLVAIQDAKSGANTDDAVEGILDYYRLLWRFTDELGTSHYLMSDTLSLARLIRQCPPEFQNRLLPALLELRAQWQPPKFSLDMNLRMFEARRSLRMFRLSIPIQYLAIEFFRAARARPLLAKHYNTLREVSGYGILEYRKWAEKNPKLAEAISLQSFCLDIERICRMNSSYLMSVDGLCVVLANEQYKRDHGQYAGVLQDLVPDYLPAVPIDPFSGTPFLYRRDGDDYRLYVTGYDGRDDGGRRYHCTDILIYIPPGAE